MCLCIHVDTIIRTKINFLTIVFILFTERCMNFDEKLSDTLSKWERISRGAVRDNRLIFKVRISCFFCFTSIIFSYLLNLFRSFKRKIIWLIGCLIYLANWVSYLPG